MFDNYITPADVDIILHVIYKINSLYDQQLFSLRHLLLLRRIIFEKLKKNRKLIFFRCNMPII